jgi:hypothetical protein
MTTTSLPNTIELSTLKQAYLEALAIYKVSNSEKSLVRLNAIKETYVTFIEYEEEA